MPGRMGEAFHSLRSSWAGAPRYIYSMTKAEKIAAFDPNGVGVADAGLFGLPFTPEEADLVVIPVPWEVTGNRAGGFGAGRFVRS